MLYFAYGSNMDEEELKGYIRSHGGNPTGIKNPRYAVLVDWRLLFNFFSQRWRAGAASIEPAEDNRVEGILWDVADNLVEYIDWKEGASTFYQQTHVAVEVQGSLLQSALTYEVVPDCRQGFCPPRRAYLQLMLQAAHRFGFSHKYVEMLEDIQTCD